MNRVIKTLRRVLGIGLAWAILWGAFWVIVGVIIRIIDPDSIDPGEGPMVVAAILGPMGLFSGVAFGILLSIWGRGRTNIDLSLTRVAGWGFSVLPSCNWLTLITGTSVWQPRSRWRCSSVRSAASLRWFGS